MTRVWLRILQVLHSALRRPQNQPTHPQRSASIFQTVLDCAGLEKLMIKSVATQDYIGTLHRSPRAVEGRGLLAACGAAAALVISSVC